MTFRTYAVPPDTKLFECAEPLLIASERDATDVIATAFAHRPDWIVIPLGLLAPQFLDLKSGLAGAVLQKFVTYHFRVAVVGDTAKQVGASAALGDFIREANRGNQIWFCSTREELMLRLQPRS